MAIESDPRASFTLSSIRPLHTLTQAVLAAPGLPDIYSAALNCLAESLGVKRASVLLFDPDKVMRFKASQGLSDEYRQAVEGHTPWTPETRDPQPVLVPDVFADESLAGYATVFEKEEIAALAFIPLVASNRLLGKFMLYYSTPHHFVEDEVLLAQTIATQVAFAIDQHHARADAEDRERQYQELVESLGLAVYTTDAQGRILLYNSAAVDLWGRAPTIGEDLWCGSWKIFTPEGHSLPLDSCPMAVALKEQRPVRGVEILVERPDGSRAHVLPYPTPLCDRNGRLTGAVNVLVDITERKLTEIENQRLASVLANHVEELETLLAVAPIGIAVARDPKADDIALNPAAAKMLGIELGQNASKSAPGGEDLPFTVTENGQAVDAQALPMQRAVREDMHFDAQEFEVTRKDGSRSSLLEYASPLHDKAGNVRGALGIFVDITERKQAEDALNESERRHRELVEGIGVAVYTTDTEGRITHYNEAAARLWGRNPEIGMDKWCGSLQMLRPDGSELPHEQCPMARALIEQRTVHGDEAIIVRPDGSRIWVETYPTPLRDSRGSVTGAVNVFLDITRRKSAEIAQAETSLRLAEEVSILQTLEKVGATVASELDLETAVQAVTDAATRLTGAQFGAFFYNLVNAEGESYTLYTLSGAEQASFENFPLPRATALFGPTFRGEGTMRVDDVLADPRYGKSAPYFGMPEGHLPVRSYLAIPVISAAGEVLGGLFFGHSEPAMFSERHEQLAQGLSHWAAVAIENASLYGESMRATREAETARQRYLDLVQGLDAVVWEADAQTLELTFVSRRAEDLFGYPMEDWLSQPQFWADHIHPEDREWALKYCRTCTDSLEDHQFEYRMMASDGRVIWVRDHVHVIQDESGRPSLLRGVMIDLTDRKAAEEDLQRAYELKDQFLGLVSHELRTPTSTIIANALILAQHGDVLTEKDRSQALADIADEGQKLHRVIENLLTLTRIEAAGNVNKVPLALEAMLHAQVAALHSRHPGRTVEISVEGTAPTVLGQATLIDIVLENFLSNAAKYSTPNTTIDVFMSGESDQATIRVCDRGIGIAESELPRLFSPFYRTNTAKDYATGMGLGLAVCKRVIEAHGGRIWAQIRDGGGAEFGFSLPAASPSGNDEKA